MTLTQTQDYTKFDRLPRADALPIETTKAIFRVSNNLSGKVVEGATEDALIAYTIVGRLRYDQTFTLPKGANILTDYLK